MKALWRRILRIVPEFYTGRLGYNVFVFDDGWTWRWAIVPEFNWAPGWDFDRVALIIFFFKWQIELFYADRD